MITQESIFEKIGGLLQELTDQYAFLQKNPGEQKGVHLELFEANISYLLGHAAILQKLTSIEEQGSGAENSIGDIPAEVQKQSEEQSEIAGTTTEEETELPKLKEEESALNYVDRQEVKETYFTPATASLDEKAEEFKLDDKQNEKEEEAGESGNEPTKEKVAEEDKKDEKQKQEQEPVNQSRTDSDLAEEEEPKEEKSISEDKVEQKQVEEKAEEKSEPHAKQIIEEERSVALPVEEVKQETKPFDRPQEPKRPMTLNELFSAQRKQQDQHKAADLQQAATAQASSFNPQASTLSTKKITDIKSAVSLNDKLLFIKDLFNGYSLAYTEAIELLSRYDNFADADAFLQSNYAQKNNWASKQATVDKLYNILKQRFG